MASADFIIEEVGDRTSALEPEKFVWSAASIPPDAARGGARAIPKKPWPVAGKQHTVRTDYPGAISPSEQVLGPRFEPFTLSGRWDDRYNFAGYAQREKQRFEDMCRRGNPVHIQFEAESWLGIIVEWSTDYRRAWDIAYSFTFSNHGHPGADGKRQVSVADPVPTVRETFERAARARQALVDDHTTAPAPLIKGESHHAVEGYLEDITAKLDALGQAVATADALGPLTTFRRMASQLRMAAGSAMAITDALVAVRSDTELAARTAKAVLDFECWRRAVSTRARLLAGHASRGADDLERRAEPDPIRVYRPFAGESLYAVSRRFYGTPHGWRLIAARNGLRSLTLDGTELLLIPVRGEG